VKRWWSLVKKEWRSSWTVVLLALIAVCGFDTWLAIKAPVWSVTISGGLAFGLSFIPFAGIGIATYIIGYLIMRYEWRDRTSLRLLSYPMSGAGIISAKLLVAVLALGLIAVVAAAGTWLVTQRSLLPPPAIASLTEDILQLKPMGESARHHMAGGMPHPCSCVHHRSGDFLFRDRHHSTADSQVSSLLSCMA